MNLCCIKCSQFMNNNYIKIKREIDGKINPYSECVDYFFKRFATMEEEKLGDLLRNLDYI